MRCMPRGTQPRSGDDHPLVAVHLQSPDSRFFGRSAVLLDPIHALWPPDPTLQRRLTRIRPGHLGSRRAGKWSTVGIEIGLQRPTAFLFFAGGRSDHPGGSMNTLPDNDRNESVPGIRAELTLAEPADAMQDEI